MLTVKADPFPLRLAKGVITDGLRKGIHEAVEKGADAAVRYARAHHPHQRRTGLLTSRASLKWRPVRITPTSFFVDFMATAPYAPFVEFRTKPHIILPRNAKVLRFVVGGVTVYAKKVKHPGSKAMPFVEPAPWIAGKAIVDHVGGVIVPRLAQRVGG